MYIEWYCVLRAIRKYSLSYVIDASAADAYTFFIHGDIYGLLLMGSSSENVFMTESLY